MPIHKRRRPTCCEKISNLYAKICAREKQAKIYDEEMNNPVSMVDATAYMNNNAAVDTYKENE